MGRPEKSDIRVWVITILSLFILVQIGVLFRKLNSASAPTGPTVEDLTAPPLRIGEHLDSLVLSTPRGAVVVRGALIGWDTLTVLAFNSRCQFCDSVGTLWRDWMRESGHRVIALSREPLDSAVAYARAQEWDCLVGTFSHGSDSLRLRWITGRTPWFFSFGPNGRLVRAGHGEQVDPGSWFRKRVLDSDRDRQGEAAGDV
jgi:hypothetical protein